MLLERPHQAGAQPRQGDVGVDLIEADLDVPPADAPAAGDVGAVVAAAEQLAQPADQGTLEAGDLLGAAGDDLAGVGVALDFVVEVIDQFGQVGRDQAEGGGDLPGVVVRPAHVGL